MTELVFPDCISDLHDDIRTGLKARFGQLISAMGKRNLHDIANISAQIRNTIATALQISSDEADKIALEMISANINDSEGSV